MTTTGRALGREAELTARLTLQRQLAEKLRAHTIRMRDALTTEVTNATSASRLLVEAARISADALATRRTSIWLFDEHRQHLVRRVLLLDGVEQTRADNDPLLQLPIRDCPTYLAALINSPALRVDDALSDPRTAELTSYLKERDVRALLDIPILAPGRLEGVVCHVGAPRAWLDEEADFAANIGGLVALALEAERRVAAERARAGTEARYRHLVESLPVTVYEYSLRTHRFEYLSPQVEALTGRTAERWLELGPTAWLDAIEPNHRPPVQARLGSDPEAGIEPEIVYRLRPPDGTRRWIRDTCSIVRDALGRPVGVQGMLADITALREAELGRSEVERSLTDLFENIELVAIILDRQLRVRFANSGFSRLTGYQPGDILGNDWFSLMVPSPDRSRIRDIFERDLARGTVLTRHENPIITRSGKQLRILWANAILRDGQGEVTGFASLGLDVTSRAAREAAERHHERLESLGRLAADVAHDFNGLITIMNGALTELDSDRSDAARRELSDALAHATSLVRSLLEFGRVDSDDPSYIIADEVVSQTIPLMTALASTGVGISTTLGAGATLVGLQAHDLRQLLLNLVKNSVDAIADQGGTIRVTTSAVVLDAEAAAERSLDASGAYFELVVADDGPGMTEAVRQRALDPFFTTKPKAQGTGLGLAICAAVAHRAGGRLTLDSAPGKGTSVTVNLPIEPIEPIELGAAAAPAPLPAARKAVPPNLRATQPLMRRPDLPNGEPSLEATTRPRVGPPTGPGARPMAAASVLLIEDQAIIRSLMRRLLVPRGYLVLEAPDLAAAAAALEGHGVVDLVIADCRLPDGDGSSFARVAQEQGQARRVIVTSGEPVNDTWPGLNLVLPKPFSADALVRAVEQALASNPPD
jgi:PAS domain S-box-containing protein